ncbi:MAG TPA: hypothetical protein VG308_04720 [Stellaceae bacterium]|jgi:hypothetical protein|nr:hypothetical protein [Stellaceae bacterium]
MNTNLAAAAVAALTLGGCAIVHPEEKLPPQPQAPGIELTKQQGGRFIALTGPRRQHTEPFLGVSDTNYSVLRSWLDNKTGEVAHQLYVEDSYYGGPYHWNGVYDTANTQLKFIPISRNQITCDLGCAYADEFAAELPDTYLRAHKDSGIAVTFTSANGKTLAAVAPPEAVNAELNALDAVREVAKNAAASPTVPPPAAPPGSPASAPKS